MNQTEAIREAFKELGRDATRDEVEAWLTRHAVERTASFDSIVSKERKKLKGTVDSWADVPTIAEPPGMDFPIEALVELRKLVGDDVNEFRRQVNRVMRAVQLTGDLATLNKFLEVWAG